MNQIYISAIGALLTALAAGGLAIVGSVIAIRSSLVREREERNFSYKSDLYQRIVNFYYNILKNLNDGNIIDENYILKLADEMFEIKKALIIRGNVRVLRVFEKIEKGLNGENNLENIQILEDLIIEIRKDLGHKDGDLRQYEFTGNFLLKDELSDIRKS